MMGSSLVLSSEIVHDGVMRRSERTRGVDVGTFESDGTVIVSAMSWAVVRDMVGIVASIEGYGEALARAVCIWSETQRKA